MFRGKKIQRRLLRGLALVVAGVLGVAIPVAMAGGWGAGPTYVSSDTGTQTQEAPAVAVSGNGDVAALWLHDSTATTAGTATLEDSFDTGTGFGTTAEISTTADPLAAYTNDYPQVVEDSAGDATAAWISNGSLEAGYQAAGASGFSDSAIDTQSYPVQDQSPRLALDSAGDVIATWEQYENTYGTYSVWYAIKPANATAFGTPQSLQTGLGGEPTPDVAVNSSGDAVIVWIDSDSGSVYYAYSSSLSDPTFGSDTAIGSTLGSSQTSDYYDPVVAIAGDGDAAVAWDFNSDSGNFIYEGDLSQVDANAQDQFPDANAIGQGNGDSSPLDAYFQYDPAIAMKSSTDGDDTTALAFYDNTDSAVAVYIRPSSDYGTSWNDLESTALWSTANQDWTQQDESNTGQQPQIALESSAVGDDGPLTMVWSDGQYVYAITSGSDGTFTSAATLEGDGTNVTPGQNCNDLTEACMALGANATGDIAALWQQDDSSSNLQVVADCYQASAQITVTTSSDPSACNSLSATVPTTSSSTTPGSTTTSGSDSTGATTPTTPTTPTTTPTTTSTTPEVDQTIIATTVNGTVMVLLPGSSTPVPLSSLESIPNGSVIEPGSGTVTLTFALPDGQTETGTFWGGDFKVLQSPSGSVNLTLIGGSFKGCPAPPKQTKKTKKKPKLEASAAKAKKPTKKKPGSTVRSLWSNAKGSFTTSGQNGAAAVLGTTWLTRDQCDGTYFYVKSTSNDPQGAIEVTVLHPHKHKVKLKRGHHLLAPAPGYSG